MITCDELFLLELLEDVRGHHMIKNHCPLPSDSHLAQLAERHPKRKPEGSGFKFVSWMASKFSLGFWL